MKQTTPTAYQQVILADSYPIFASALKRAISSCNSRVEISKAENFDALFQQIETAYQRFQPPLVFWDIRLPGSCGRAGLAELAAAFTDLPIVVIHDVIYHEATQGILGEDLTGVITRHVCEKKLEQIISCLLQGRRWFPAQMLAQMPASDGSLNGESVRQLRRLGKVDSITKSQMKVMRQVLIGRMNKQIAYDLGLSEATVKVHVSGVMKKLGVQNRSELISFLLNPDIHRLGRCIGR